MKPESVEVREALMRAYESVIEDLSPRCDYADDSEGVRVLDALEARYAQLRIEAEIPHA